MSKTFSENKIFAIMEKVYKPSAKHVCKVSLRNGGYVCKMKKPSKLSVRMFLLLLLCVVMPLAWTCIYVRVSMERFIQEKLSEKVIQNISRGERNICGHLQDTAALTNVFTYDEELLKCMADPEALAYDNTKYFDRLVNKLATVSGFDFVQDVKIILFDEYGRIYSNWSMNYQDYQFLLEQDWVKKSRENSGHIVWSMFSPAYIIGEEKGQTYISLSKSLLKDYTAGERVGTLVISIDQKKFSDFLMEYAYDGDVAYVCVGDGAVLLANDDRGLIRGEDISRLYRDTENEESGSLKYRTAGGDYLITYYTIPRPWVFDGQQMKVFHFTGYEEVTGQMELIGRRMNFILFFVLCALILILYFSVRLMVKPIARLSDQMENYTLDMDLKDIDVARSDEIGRLNRSFLKMSGNIRNLFGELEREHEVKEKYRYESLRAQLNPHFLFNTLSTIRWMAIIRGADNIVDGIDALAHILKYSMSREGGLVTVEEEVENIKNYLYIQNCRYGNHCRLETDLEEKILNLKTAKFIFQPIVENAVIHGYDKDREEILIRIYGFTEEDKLKIYVEDNGIGISPGVIRQFEDFRKGQVKESKLTGIGIKNVDEYLRITFGDAYGLTIEIPGAGGTAVLFTLPIIEKETAEDEKGNDRG